MTGGDVESVRPIVSVIVPVCNSAKYLAECLDSALAQTLPDLEVICMDDGSTDSSPALLDEYAFRDSRVHVEHKANSGFGDTMNRGIALARGKYIAFLESDDFIERDAYAELVAAAEKSGAEIVKGNYFEFRGDGVGRQTRKVGILGRRLWRYGRIYSPRKDHWLFYVPMMNPLGIFRRDWIERNGIRHNTTPGASYQDMGFWFQTMCHAERVQFLRKAYYHYRQDNPTSSMNNLDRAFVVQREFDFMRRFLADHPAIHEWVAPIFYHRMFRAYQFRMAHLSEALKRKFVDEVVRVDMRGVFDDPFFTTDRFSREELQVVREMVRG